MSWPPREVGYQPPKADIRPQALIYCMWPKSAGRLPLLMTDVRSLLAVGLDGRNGQCDADGGSVAAGRGQFRRRKWSVIAASEVRWLAFCSLANQTGKTTRRLLMFRSVTSPTRPQACSKRFERAPDLGNQRGSCRKRSTPTSAAACHPSQLRIHPHRTGLRSAPTGHTHPRAI